MERIKTSIIIPAYREVDNLPSCVASLKAQTIPFDEIIVVDNNSCDETADVARELGCIVVWEGNPGLSEARNAGARAAKGKVIGFIDADGRMCPVWHEESLKSMQDPRVVAVSGLNVLQHNNRLKGKWYNGYTVTAYTYVLANHKLFGHTFLVGNNLVIKKDVFLSLGGFKPVIGEDYRMSKKFWESPNLKGTVNLNMVTYISSRRFDEHGYIRTILGWLINTARQTPQVKYTRLASQTPLRW